MARVLRVLGLIVAGGAPPLGDVDLGADPALTPFAGTYRFIDFALATLRNSGVQDVCVLGPAGAGLEAHVAAAGGAPGRRHGVRHVAVSGVAPRSRAARLLHALGQGGSLVGAERFDSIVVLMADHILHVDLRRLIEVHRGSKADVTLAALPVAPDEARLRTVLCTASDGRLEDVRVPQPRPDGGPGDVGLSLSWAGDVVLTPATLAAVPAPGGAADNDRRLLHLLADARHVAAYDVIGDRPAEGHRQAAAYWHDPTTLEVYYEAQMDLCRLRPVLDLYDPSWPVRPAPSGLGPAKVVADAAGRSAHAINTLVADGAIICGATVVNGVLGHGVVIDSGAEVEDSVLLDGCRIGRHARVRRAVVGAGAVVADGEEIGFSACPPPHARVERSGLTVLPAGAGAV